MRKRNQLQLKLNNRSRFQRSNDEHGPTKIPNFVYSWCSFNLKIPSSPTASSRSPVPTNERDMTRFSTDHTIISTTHPTTSNSEDHQAGPDTQALRASIIGTRHVAAHDWLPISYLGLLLCGFAIEFGLEQLRRQSLLSCMGCEQLTDNP